MEEGDAGPPWALQKGLQASVFADVYLKWPVVTPKR